MNSLWSLMEHNQEDIETPHCCQFLVLRTMLSFLKVYQMGLYQIWQQKQLLGSQIRIKREFKLEVKEYVR